MTYHKTVEDILNLLKKNNLWFDYMEHEPVRTSEEAARIRPKYTMNQGTKALIVRIKKTKDSNEFVMLVVPGDKKFNKDKLKKYLEVKDIRFATENEVMYITRGVVPGGVPPFGNLFGIRVIADSEIFSNNIIVFNAGDRRVSIAIKSEDYKSIVSPDITGLT